MPGIWVSDERMHNMRIVLTAMHIHPAPEISQHQTADAAPPAYRGYEKVVVIVAKQAEILAAKENVAKKPKSRLNTFKIVQSARSTQHVA